jgi:hypothetical protein
MDREWTGKFFGLHAPEWQTDQRRTFVRVYSALAAVARATDPERLATGAGWRTSMTKVLDNALIAYCRIVLRGDPTAALASQRISFTVEGTPPAKNEALSIFSAGHSQVHRVRALLHAAQDAIKVHDFIPVDSESLELDLVVHAPPRTLRSDATNFLGGVADTLENKVHRNGLSHLGDLATVFLYQNDRQIKRITYQEIADQRLFYQVAFSVIDHSQSRD